MCSAAFVKRGFAAASAAFMGVGAYLLVHPGLLPAVCTLLGVVFVSYGAVKLMGYFSDDLYRLAFQFDLGVGILTILVGCVLLLRPRDRLALLPMVIGAFVLVDESDPDKGYKRRLRPGALRPPTPPRPGCREFCIA